MRLALALRLLCAAAAASWCSGPGSCLRVSFYRGGAAGDPELMRLLSDHALFVRKNRAVPAVIVKLTNQTDALAMKFSAATMRAVLLPEDESLLVRFAEAAGTADRKTRQRLFVGVIVKHSTKRFTGKRFIHILELLRTSYLDLIIVRGKSCRKPSCSRNRMTRAFEQNWRNLLRLAGKRRILNLGVSGYPKAAVRALHRVSTMECLKFPQSSPCQLPSFRYAGKENRKARSPQEHKKDKRKSRDSDKKHGGKSTPVDLSSAYSMSRSSNNTNFLTVVLAPFNPFKRHRSLRRWCHRHLVVFLTKEPLGGAQKILDDRSLKNATAAVKLPGRIAVLDWALRKRVAIALTPLEAMEFAGNASALLSQVDSQHLALIDGLVKGDTETRYFETPSFKKPPARVKHNEL